MKILEDIYGLILFGRLCKFSAKCLFVSAVGMLPVLSIPLMTGLYNKLDDTPQRGAGETMQAHAPFKATALLSCFTFGCLLLMFLLTALLQSMGVQTMEDLQVIPGHALFEGVLTLFGSLWLLSVFAIMIQYLWLKSRVRNKVAVYNNQQ